MHTDSTALNPIDPNRPAPEKLAFTIAEACAAVGIGKTSIYELISDGKLRSVKAAGRRLILRADLEDYLQSCRDTS
jgi:excisionase family DNA binding protein